MTIELTNVEAVEIGGLLYRLSGGSCSEPKSNEAKRLEALATKFSSLPCLPKLSPTGRGATLGDPSGDVYFKHHGCYPSEDEDRA
jgi:hypothetical protein